MNTEASRNQKPAYLTLRYLTEPFDELNPCGQRDPHRRAGRVRESTEADRQALQKLEVRASKFSLPETAMSDRGAPGGSAGG